MKDAVGMRWQIILDRGLSEGSFSEEIADKQRPVETRENATGEGNSKCTGPEERVTRIGLVRLELSEPGECSEAQWEKQSG